MVHRYISEDSNDYNDENVIAVVFRDDVKITFIKVDSNLTDADYECLSWFDMQMLIGISSFYLDHVIDSIILARIDQEIATNDIYPSSEIIEELSIRFLRECLADILDRVAFTSDPETSSIDMALNAILDED